MTKRSLFQSVSLALSAYVMAAGVAFAEAPFPIPDTMQSTCYDATQVIKCPAAGAAFYGQDAQIDGTQPSYTDNGDGTFTDNVTGLMWAQTPDMNGDGVILAEDKMSYDDAMTGAESYDLGGYDDWRVPTIKELQGIVDYTRSPATTQSPAIDPVFESTMITNEAGQDDYGWIWSSTTHSNWTDEPGSAGAYVAFGRATGFFDGVWTDVHGAGSQRSDPKRGDPADYPEGDGPLGDAKRI